MNDNKIKNIDQKKQKYFFRASAEDFKKIPGCPIAYWVSKNISETFIKYPLFSSYSDTRIGLITGDNDRYIRQWHEVDFFRIGFNFTRSQAHTSMKKWFPQSKGGEFRRWYGNNNTVVDWFNDGHELQTRLHNSGERTLAHNFNLDRIFDEGITWTKISSGVFAARYQPKGFLFNDASANAFPLVKGSNWFLMGFLATKIPSEILMAMNPTLNFLPGNIANLPISPKIVDDPIFLSNTKRLVQLSKNDWDSYEISWDFVRHPLLGSDEKNTRLKTVYTKLRNAYTEITVEMQSLETENNRICIAAYNLEDELTSEVPLNVITLTCNPHYRYGGEKTEDELEALLLADTIRELISYAVGCMFGRYSIDKPGLILANQADTLAKYLKQIPEPRFCAVENNVIPILDSDWFTDDITGLFCQFLRVAFGEDHYKENLLFVEMVLGKKGKSLPIRDYFLKDFYNDHTSAKDSSRIGYKKRPIYWMFSSPNGTFNALIYLHRYSPDTVSVVLNNYLREFRNKLASNLSYLQQVGLNTSSSQVEKTRANNEIDTIKKQLQELDDYERDVLYPLATQQVQLDLDDGVKVNYLKLGPALKKISGLDAKDED